MKFCFVLKAYHFRIKPLSLSLCSEHAQTWLPTHQRIAHKLLWTCLQFTHSKFSTLSQSAFNQVRFLLTYLKHVIQPWDFLGVVVVWDVSGEGRGGVSCINSHPATHSYPLKAELWPAIEPWRLSLCSAGFATMFSRLCYLFSRLCYPVQQAMLPCSAGYATLFSRLCYHVQQAMLPCSVGYATTFSRLCYPVQQAMLSKVENKVKLSPA